MRRVPLLAAALAAAAVLSSCSTFDASTALEMLGFLGPEVKEGLASHLEKRKPKFDPYSPL